MTSSFDLSFIFQISNLETMLPTDIPTLLKVLRWPRTAENPPFNPMLDVVRLAFVNPSKNGLASTILQSGETTNEFADILIGYISDSQKPINQMLAVKVVTNIFSCDKGKGYHKRLTKWYPSNFFI